MKKIPFEDVWCQDAGVGDPFLFTVMPRNKFRSIHKHFRCVSPAGLLRSGEPNYHPYQDVLGGIDILRNNSCIPWIASRFLPLDESRIKSTSHGDT